jgi:hypothetical protein
VYTGEACLLEDSSMEGSVQMHYVAQTQLVVSESANAIRRSDSVIKRISEVLICNSIKTIATPGRKSGFPCPTCGAVPQP